MRTLVRRLAAASIAIALAACSRPPAPPEQPAQPGRTFQPTALIFPTLLDEGWETGLGSWTAATTSGTCTWHVLDTPQSISVTALLNPLSVTLPDSGAHLPARTGSRVAWFGEDTTGTFIGTPFVATANNGGQSTAVQAGTLTSPAISLAGFSKAAIEFDSWWEIEGVAGQSFDIMTVEVSSDGGGSFSEIGRLNPTFATNAPGQSGYTAGGSSAPPEWRHYAFDVSAHAGQTVLVRFGFNTNDMAYNGFRGWTIDNVTLGGGSAFPAPVISAATPAVGTVGDAIAVDGANFMQGATFWVGTNQITAFGIMQFGTDHLLFLVPAGLTPGAAYDLRLVNPDGQSTTLVGGFTYSGTPSPTVSAVSPATGSVGVAQAVTIAGANFVAGSTVAVGPYAATDVVVGGAGSITATFPAMPAGNYNVTVTSPSGQSGTAFAAYTVPVVLDLSTITVTSPNGGETWAAGGTHAITWTELLVSTVALDLYRGGSFDRTIATGLSAATGSYAWAIPAGLAPGADYTVKARNQLGSSSDYSDAPFTVTAVVSTPTATALAAAPSPSAYGQPVALTATVTSGAGTPTGSVTFDDGGSAIAGCTGLPLVAGTVTCDVAVLGAGVHANLTASYTPTGDFQASVSSALSHTVDQATTTTALAATPSPSTFGQAVALTATVTSTHATPAGAVTFLDGGSPISGCVALALAAGAATCTTSTLAVGNHANLTADFSGSADFLGSSSAGLAHVVDQAASAVAVLSSLNPSTFGQGVTLTATVTGPGGTPGGTVTFRDAGLDLAGCTAVALTAGAASCDLSGLGGGTHPITADYGGDATYLAGSGSLDQVVERAVSAVALASSGSPSTFGQLITLTATVSAAAGTPGGTVTLQDGGVDLAGCTGLPLSAGVATCATAALGVGTHALTAAYPGDADFLPATGGTSQQVNQAATTTALASSDLLAPAGTAITLTATVAVTAPGAGAPGGTVTFLNGGTSLGTVAVAGGVATLSGWTPPGGTYGLTATYAGDAGFAGSSSAELLQQVLGTFPIAEPFREGTAAGWELFGTAALTSGGLDPASEGWLRLTSADNSQAGSALYAPPFASSQGIVVSFDYATYGGSGADGFSFYLIDGATLAPTLGASGGSLGYAQALAGCGGAVDVAGVTNGYVGIGFDEYGNFSTCNVGTGGPGQVSGSVAIRGSGDRSSPGFQYLAGQPVPGGIETGSRAAARRVRISVVEQKVKVELDQGSGFATVVDGVDLATAAGQAALPATFKMGLSASTGGANNVHELRNLNVATPATLTVANLAAPTSAAVDDAVTWTVSVANDALNDVAGLALAVPVPAGLGAVTWTATAAGGAVVPNASGTGAIAETIDLPRNGSAVFAFSGTLSSAAAGSAVTATATITPPPSIANLGNGSASASVAVGRLASAVALASSSNPSVYGSPVTYTATVTGAGAVPTGTVTFLDGGSLDLCGPVALVAGAASCPVALSVAGAHAITAAYSGDLPYLPAGDALTQVVERAGATVDLVASTNPSIHGAPATFTATVTSLAPGGDAPGGSVVFLDGTTTLGSSPIAAGVASFTTDRLPAGTRTIVASYGGDGSFAPADSAPVTQEVTRAPTAVAVVRTPAAPVTGEDVLFTVTVDRAPPAAGFTPGGEVELLDGATRLQTLTLTGGAASWTSAALAVGPHAITVHYLGAAEWQASSSATDAFDMAKGSTTTALATSLAATVFGQPLQLAATVAAAAPALGSPSGTVTFRDGAAVLGTATVVAATGEATLTWPDLAVGAHDLTATYEGDARFLTSASAAGAAPVTVARAAVTVALASSAATGSVIGQPVTFTVTVGAAAPGAGTPTGDVTLADGATTLATAPLSGGTATFTTGALPVGDHALSASYAGDGSFLPGSATATQAVGQGSTTVSVASGVTPSRFGQPVTWTATVAAVAPAAGTPSGGTVAFTAGAAPIGGCTAVPVAAGEASCTSGALPAGSHAVGAAYSGDGSFLASSGQVTQQVDPAAASLALDVSPSPAAYGQTVTVTLRVTAAPPGQGIPSAGTVTFTDGATVLCGPTALTAGAASCAAAGLVAGTHPLAAAFSGDPDFVPQTTTASLTVTPGTTQVAVASSRNPSRRGRPVTFTATVSSPHATPGGTVTFRDGATLLGSGTLAGGVATLSTRALLKGDHPISAEYTPSADFAVATGSLAPVQVVENTPPVAGAGTALALGAGGAVRADIPAPGSLLDQPTLTVELQARATWSAPGDVTSPSLFRLGAAGGPRLALGLSPDRTRLVVGTGTTATEIAAPLDDGGWHHLALVATATDLDLFVDGAHVGNVAGGLAAAPTAAALTIGDGLTGLVDELRIWSVSRTAAELAAGARRPLQGNEDGLVGCWRLDEGSGGELFDAGPGALDGTLALDDVATPAPFAPSTAWSRREVWQERDMAPADAGYDADGDPLVLTISAAPQHGTASIDAAGLQVGYHAGDGYLGQDLLTFRLDDGTATGEYQLELTVNRILVCRTSADCGGGDLCVQGACEDPAALSARSGSCGCSSGAGGATALWALLVLALAARPGGRRTVAAARRQP